MSEDLKKILPFISDSYKWKNVSKSSDNKKKLAQEQVDKEVLNLTNGLFPLQPSSPFLIEVFLFKNSFLSNLKKNKVKSEWIYHPIMFSSEKKMNAPIFHWIPKSDKEKYFAYERFNISTELETFSEEEYTKYLNDLDPSWSFEETCYLWTLCHRFDLRFLVISDRYDEKYHRTVEDLKSRYYSVTRKLLEVRNEANNPLFNYVYDPDYEKIRKFHLEKFLMRPKEKNEEEKKLFEELKKIEQKIKKEEKEQMSLQKILKTEVKEEDISDQDNKEDELSLRKMNEEKQLIRKQKEKIAFLRGTVMHAPLPISPKLSKKLSVVLAELNIPMRPIPTAENEMLYDRLREQILIWFNLQKHLKKKEMEKQNLEKKREMKFNEDSIHGSMMQSIGQSREGDKRKFPFPDESLKMMGGYKKVKTFQ